MDNDSLVALARARALCTSGAARAARLAAGLSLGEVGKALEKAPSTIYRWEKGERQPRGEAGIRYGELLARLLNPGGRA
jgi:transcriptional regulator with XRE-family HTH domain